MMGGINEAKRPSHTTIRIFNHNLLFLNSFFYNFTRLQWTSRFKTDRKQTFQNKGNNMSKLQPSVLSGK